MGSVEGPDSAKINMIIANQMIHRPHNLIVRSQKIFTAVRIGWIIDHLKQGIPQMGHPANNGKRIGILQCLVLHGYNATHVLQFGLGPFHHAKEGRSIGVSAHTINYLDN